MKKLLLLFICISIISNTLSSAVLFLSYTINKTYITQTLCVNKSNPKAHCNGKCHLMKEIKENEEKNTAPTSTSFKEKIEITQYVSQQSYQGLFKLNLKAIISTPYKESFLPDVSFSFFHPPKA